MPPRHNALDYGELMPQSNALLRAILNAEVDGIVTIDERGLIESCNQSVEKLFGYSAAELIGHNVKLLMPPPYREEHDSHLQNYLETGHKKIIDIGREVLGRRKDGSVFPVFVRVSEVHMADRRLFTGILRDLSELKDMEKLLWEQSRAIHEANEDMLYRLALAVVCHDRQTGWHIQRTGAYSELLAISAGWSCEQAHLLRLAAPLHDIGKIGIPDAILHKPGALTPEETLVMQEHTVLGAKMLDRSMSPVLSLARDIALCHHERWDGRGYPRGLAGTGIPESARIVAVVDMFDALIHDRVYRPAWPESKVIQMILESRGTHLDPRLVDLFLPLLSEMQTLALAMPDSASTEFDDAVIADGYVWERRASASGHAGTVPAESLTHAAVSCGSGESLA